MKYFYPKQKIHERWIRKRLLLKTLLIMKIQLVLLLISLQVSAHDFAQKVTLNEKNVSIAAILEKITNETGVYFWYDNSIISNKNVSVYCKNLPLEKALDEICIDQSFIYEKINNNIYTFKKKEIVVTKNTPAVTENLPPLPPPVHIKGRVTDEKGQPLIKASIIVKGTRYGTTTNENGEFSLDVSNTVTHLIISYIGYENVEVNINGRTEFNIILKSTTEQQQEVVVVGYGTQRKYDVTGSISTISTNSIKDIPVGSVDQIMQGKASGVAVTQNTGAPGAGVSVIIRGQASFGTSTPLYVIDGIPTDDGINEISPNDIESISVLKDASSASIYGARAANGVVLITTKKGLSGKPRLSLNFYTGWQSPAHLIKMANSKEYLNAYNTAAANDSIEGSISNRALLPLEMLDTLPDVNWQKAILKTAPVSSINIGIVGGNENTKYALSGTYYTQDGMIINSGFQKGNLHTSLTSTLSRFFKVGTNLNLSYSQNRQVGSSGDGYGSGNPGASVVRYALFRTPATPVVFPDGPNAGQYVDLPLQGPNGYNFLGDGLNPVALAANTDRNFYNYAVLGDLFVELTPIKNLKIKSDVGTNVVYTRYKQFYPTWNTYSQWGSSSDFFYPAARIQNSPNALSQSNTLNFNYNWTNTANYDWMFSKNVFNFLVGTEIVYNKNQYDAESQNKFPNQSSSFQYLSNGTSTTPSVSGVDQSWALSSIFGRINYQYDSKYMASFNFRRDGSSRLDPATQWGNFFSGSLGWRIDREEFMKNIKQISLLKLRASVGQLGDVSALPNYGYASLIGPTGYYVFGTSPALTYTVYQTGNTHLKWQSSLLTDIGMDLAVFNNKLNVTIDYYRKMTSDLLQAPYNPTSAGTVASPAYVNNGKILNDGFEFEVGWHDNINKDWSYEIDGNLTTLHNEVRALLNNQPLPAGRVDNNTYATLTAVGHPVGSFYMLQMEGIFQNNLDVMTHAYQGSGIRPGDVKFKDVNNDGIIDQNDRVFAGSPIPTFTYSFTGKLFYKNFDLSLFFQGVSGDKIYSQVNMDIEGFYRPFNITERVATQSWHGEGTSNTFPILSWTDATNNKQMSTRFLQDGSYLRLKNAQIGYTLNSKALNKLKISSLRIYVSVQNVFTITKYLGLDPEMTSSADAQTAGDGAKALNIDWGTYPSARTSTIGVNVNF